MESKRTARAGLLRAIARLDGRQVGSADCFIPPMPIRSEDADDQGSGNPLSEFVLGRHLVGGASDAYPAG